MYFNKIVIVVSILLFFLAPFFASAVTYLDANNFLIEENNSQTEGALEQIFFFEGDENAFFSNENMPLLGGFIDPNETTAEPGDDSVLISGGLNILFLGILIYSLCRIKSHF
jgi:hypothetical protein